MELLSAAVWVLVWIPVTVWTLKTVHATVVGDMDAATGLLASVLGPFLGFLTIVQEHPWARVGLFAAITLTVVGYPILTSRWERRQRWLQDEDELARAYANLTAFPDNLLARWRIAEALVSRGFVPHAVAVGKETLQGQNPTVHGEEFRTLRQWERMAKAYTPVADVRCPGCGQPNGPQHLNCPQCGEAVYIELVRNPGGRARTNSAGAWVAAIAAFLGIPAASALPPAWAVVAIVGMLVVGVGALLRTIMIAKGAGARAQ
jgi:hypothetical protein